MEKKWRMRNFCLDSALIQMLLVNVTPVYVPEPNNFTQSCLFAFCVVYPPSFIPSTWHECEEHLYLFRCVLPVSAAAERRCEVVKKTQVRACGMKITTVTTTNDTYGSTPNIFESGLAWHLPYEERSLAGANLAQAVCHGIDVTGSQLVRLLR